jgi:hypothetical protein
VSIQGYVCDRCGQVIESDRSPIEVKAGPMYAQRPTFDLCPGCIRSLKAWLDRAPEPAAVKGVPDPPRRPATLKALRGARP